MLWKCWSSEWCCLKLLAPAAMTSALVLAIPCKMFATALPSISGTCDSVSACSRRIWSIRAPPSAPRGIDLNLIHAATILMWLKFPPCCKRSWRKSSEFLHSLILKLSCCEIVLLLSDNVRTPPGLSSLQCIEVRDQVRKAVPFCDT